MKRIFTAILPIVIISACVSQKASEKESVPTASESISIPLEQTPQQAPAPRYLWEIGASDNDTSEFALGPNGYAEFGEDAVFAIGQSDPKKDWPYVHPGPADSWAGSGEHSFIIIFGVSESAGDGECSLDFDLVDTHASSPPELRIEINGHVFSVSLPKGAGDKSIFGDPSAGSEHRFSVRFPANILKKGQNEIVISTLWGSWMLYDWIGLQTPESVQAAPVAGLVVTSAKGIPALIERDGGLFQPVEVRIANFGPPCTIQARLGETLLHSFEIANGVQSIELPAQPVSVPSEILLEIKCGEEEIFTRTLRLEPVRRWVIYVLPHSHVDIGYTELQTKVERDHWRFYEEAIQAAKKTADYPPEARFKWNVEVLWAVDSYLRQATPEKQQEFIEAVKAGSIGLDALYGNELTALCRPEELFMLLDFSLRLAARTGIAIESAMISDLPGLTWGIVPVLAQNGVKYISIGPNAGDRIGATLAAWADRPFYWVSQCGKHKILCWIPRRGYWRALEQGPKIFAYLSRLEQNRYPYDYVQIRHCLGDNAGPATGLSDFVKDWNGRYAYPRFVIATTAQMFREFEARYGNVIPAFSGDFTPYWEDGAASSALETALNRAAAERLVQAQALWAMLRPAEYPDEDFYQAWRNVILYDEHTWGAHNSISEPDSDFVRSQWEIKRAFAIDADVQSKTLLKDAIAGSEGETCPRSAFRVFNTSSWPRADLVILDAGFELPGDIVKDASGNIVPSQRLSDGSLAFLANDVPALAYKIFAIEAGNAPAIGSAAALGSTISNSILSATLDEQTGAIKSLKLATSGHDFVDASSSMGLNDYFYVAGRDPSKAARNARPVIRVKEPGPLVAALSIESDAPGCRRLVREVRLVDGLNRIDIINTVDKEKIREKEGVHFAFPFAVPDGVTRMDIAWAVMRPEFDQLPGACKNWFMIQRWIDVSNQDLGVTLAIVDAPLVEVGGITAETPWMKTISPSQTIFSYVMNNYWHTNYRDSQQGPTVFRYSIAPRKGLFRGDEAAKFGIGASQPLIVAPAPPGDCAGNATPLLTIQPSGIRLESLKPACGGSGFILRLFNATGSPETVRISWGDGKERRLFISEGAGKHRQPLQEPLKMSPYEALTLIAE